MKLFMCLIGGPSGFGSGNMNDPFIFAVTLTDQIAFVFQCAYGGSQGSAGNIQIFCKGAGTVITVFVLCMADGFYDMKFFYGQVGKMIFRNTAFFCFQDFIEYVHQKII